MNDRMIECDKNWVKASLVLDTRELHTYIHTYIQRRENITEDNGNKLKQNV